MRMFHEGCATFFQSFTSQVHNQPRWLRIFLRAVRQSLVLACSRTPYIFAIGDMVPGTRTGTICVVGLGRLVSSACTYDFCRRHCHSEFMQEIGNTICAIVQNDGCGK